MLPSRHEACIDNGREMMRPHLALVVVLSILPLSADVRAQSAAAQTPAPQVFTLEQALQYAVDHYPTVKAALERVNASTAGVDIARAGYLPRLDSVWQTNRATANNVFGQLLPQAVIPAVSGPVLPSASSQGVWGSAAGALFSWEPFDFGLRGAGVRAAEAAVVRARADESLTRLEVQSAVGAAFLTVVQAEQAVAATRADVERRDVLTRVARTLADNQLRPGAEASRAEAERAAAQTRAILARQALVLAQTALTRALGVTAGTVSVNSAGLLAPAPPASAPGTATAARAHPLTQALQASVDVARTQEDLLGRTNRPRLYLQSSVFARGSGANPDGSFDGGADGLGFERANWAAGVQVVFPNLFEFASLRARRAASAASTRAESARYDEALLVIISQQQAASAMVEAARAVAANTPVQLAAAQQSEVQARARYQAGLASIVEVADTQGLLAQAEYQDAIARVEVWRALLADALAHSDLPSFVSLVGARGGVR
ncbi:MAG: TolC family protein [Acidobacteria bacterium]|nr:TolC family protein [Acidobacteriota bacterium]